MNYTIQGVYAITDEELIPGITHVDITRAALAGGIRIIQLRDKDASDDCMIEAGREIRRMTAEAGALFIVNDRLEVALACDADGLHVGQSDAPAGELRRRLGDRILGVSAGTVEEAIKARDDGADYLGVGPVFTTATKSDAGPVTGLDLIAATRDATGLPIIAIGGINASNIAQVARAGADSASVISAIVCAPDMIEASHRLVRLWDGALGEGCIGT